MVWIWAWFLTDELDQAWILGLTNMQTFTCGTLLFCVNTTWISILTQKLNACEPCIWLHNVWYKMNCRILTTTMYSSLPDFFVWITITLLQWASPWMEVLRNLLDSSPWILLCYSIACLFCMLQAEASGHSNLGDICGFIILCGWAMVVIIEVELCTYWVVWLNISS